MVRDLSPFPLPVCYCSGVAMMGRGEKMAAGRLPLVTALLLLTAAIPRGQAENFYQLSGNDYTLKPTYRGDFKEILWLLNRNKLVELELNETKAPVYYKSYPPLKAGASLNNQTGDLTIPRLTSSNSGDYRAEVKLRDLTYHYTDITLTVLDHVEKPIITNWTTEKDINLSCESASPGVSYKWQDDKGTIVSNKTSHTISKPTETAVTLTCIASNQVSNHNASVTFTPPAIGSRSTGIIVGIFVAILLLLLFEFLRWKFPEACCLSYINRYVPPFPYCKKGNGKDEDKGNEIPTVKVNPEPNKTGNGTPDQQRPLLENEESGTIDFSLNTAQEGAIAGHLISGHKNVTGSGEQNAQEVLAVNNQQVHDSGTIDFSLNTAQKDAIAGLKVKKNGKLLYEVDCMLDQQQDQEHVLKDNLVLKSGALTLKSLKPEDNKEYEFTFNENGSAQFIVKVMKEFNKNALKIRRKITQHLASENGLQEQPPTGNVTFHPSRITNKYIWKHDGKKVVGTSEKSEGEIFQDGKVKVNWQTGDLTLQDIMPENNGTYTLEFADGANQEFILDFEDS